MIKRPLCQKNHYRGDKRIRRVNTCLKFNQNMDNCLGLKIFNMSETQHTSLPVRSTQDPSKTDTQGAKHAAAASPRATTTSWTPNFERRQSWSAQDRKHELQMAAVDDVRTGPGFTERSS
ncbi:hypothetical protein LMH87_010083 [Akanthomyces muscarius]|uniref:Uncharacterized protein n=1 Tax=Akanthomyces muscarius TaxID=2231603 RepID=A0A9W8QD31_AKAMU|nr:hypothetical protein LMH87_010083 [Akanthomyces muscarius]KAJ4153601.1 hypothetical protein LMH87_010083 [Akanthomyces muscarius]